MTSPQHMLALAQAQRIRVQRADLKRHMREGRVSLADVLRANKRYIQTMTIRQLLLAVPHLGEVKADRALKALRTAPRTRLQDFSMQRREQLLAWLCDHCPQVPVNAVTAEQNRLRLAQLRITEKAKAASA